MRLYDSLLRDRAQQDVPRPIYRRTYRVSPMTSICSAASGRRFAECLYERATGRRERRAALRLSYTRGETYRYTLQTPDDGLVDYYETTALQQEVLVRKPTPRVDALGVFGYRRHRFSHYKITRSRLGGADRHADFRRRQWRRHMANGMAAMVPGRIQHANGISPLQSYVRFARGVAEGVRLKQARRWLSSAASTGRISTMKSWSTAHFVDPMRADKNPEN